ncbi:MAG: molybdopterin-dependent oxidoreductase [Campylobacterota bacterium]|nr:molybdopterin-dependent oxidoreductase [Campylobacterota bacterium]
MSHLTRRKFLKGTAAAVAGGTVFTTTDCQAREITQADFGVEKKVSMLCRMCAQFCPMVGTVRDNRLVRVEANTDTPYAAICGRGRAAMGALYDPDRIKTPMIRVGKRGDGEFREASWTEALDMVADKMKALKAENDEKSVAFLPRFNSAPMMDKEFFKVYGTPNVVGYGDACFGNGLTVGLSAVIGGKLSSGVPTQGTSAISSDYENAKYGVLMQRNPGGGLVAHAWGNMFGRGKRNGMQLTVVDPRKPSEAGESDSEWLPIRPGTDLPFLLGLMHEIFKNKFYDYIYLKKYTNSDMLINLKTGLPVKTRKIEEESKGKIREIEDYLVSVKDGVAFKSETEKSRLFGEYSVEIDGEVIKCKTALQIMKDDVAKCTPEWTQEQTTIPAKSIIDVAQKLNATKPQCFIDRGYRSERYASSFREKLTLTQINVLLGVFGMKGGVILNRKIKTAKFIHPPKSKDISIAKWYLKNVPDSALMSDKYYRRTWARSVLNEKPYKQRMAVISGQNVVGGSTGSPDIIKAMEKLEMIVAISPFLNETVMYADVVLPDCTFMERDEAFRTSYKTPIPTLAVSRKAVEPLFESKDGYWIIDQLAKRVLEKDVYAEHFGAYEREGINAIWKAQYSHLKGVSKEEMDTIPSLDALVSGEVWTGEKRYGVKEKGTLSGKIEVYSIFLAKKYNELKALKYDQAIHASPRPVHIKPNWLEKREGLGDNEFIPITGFHPLGTFTGQQTKNNTLLQEFHDDTNADAVFINRKKGLSLGFKTDDIVEVFNVDLPNLVVNARVVLSETVHPDAMFSYFGFGAGFFKEVTKRSRNLNKIGFNPNHVTSLDFNPLTTGQPSQDFIVNIRKMS